MSHRRSRLVRAFIGFIEKKKVFTIAVKSHSSERDNRPSSETTSHVVLSIRVDYFEPITVYTRENLSSGIELKKATSNLSSDIYTHTRALGQLPVIFHYIIDVTPLYYTLVHHAQVSIPWPPLQNRPITIRYSDAIARTNS